MVYKHVIGLKTDSSQSNLGGNTDSNHLIPGVVGYFSSVSLSRHPVQLVILIPFFFSPASDAGLFVCLFPGIECRCSSFCSRVFSPALFLCSVPRGIPRFVLSCSPRYSAGFFLLFPGIGCRLSSFCSRVFSPALFLCSVPRGIPRFSFLFFPGIGCRCSSPSIER